MFCKRRNTSIVHNRECNLILDHMEKSITLEPQPAVRNHSGSTASQDTFTIHHHHHYNRRRTFHLTEATMHEGYKINQIKYMNIND